MQPVSILIPSFNRLQMLVKCLDALFLTPIDQEDEIIVWNNCSTDGTKEFLDKMYDNYREVCNFKVIHNLSNIGLSAVNQGFKMMSNFYRMKVDDDIIAIPYFFKEKLINVFESIEIAGYIAAELENDKQRLPQQFFINYENPEIYKRQIINGIPLRLGDASGGFVMTTEEVLDSVGGFVEMQEEGISWFNEDSDYSSKCRTKGYLSGFLEGLKVYHAFGPLWNKPYENDYINKFCSWLSQEGIKHRSREEQKQMLLAISVNDEMAEKILNKFAEVK
jgi:GT2 family glycosyltransferase